MDVNCPRHGSLKLRGNTFTGVVVSDKMNRSVVVERKYLKKVPKYERYERSKSKITAHNPDCVAAKAGDEVVISECRKISKTKSFVVTGIKKRGEAK